MRHLPSKLSLAGAMLIAGAALVCYLPSLRGGFIMDDDFLLTKSQLIKAPDGLFRFWFTSQPFDYFPLSNSWLWVEWRIWGMNPTGYRVTNLILHIGTAWLLWAVLRQLSIPGGMLAALVFAVHPVNVESVAWIAQRKDLAAAFFFLLAILLYPKTVQPRQKAMLLYCLSLFVFLLSALSKGSTVILPLVLLALIWWVQGRVTRRDVLRMLPFIAVSTVLTFVNIRFATRGTDVYSATLLQRVLGAAGAVWFYLFKAIWPVKLAFFYPKWEIRAGDARWWIPLLACVVVTAALLRRRAFFVAWLIFLIVLLPVLGFSYVGFLKFSLVADRYMHLAIMVVVALAAAGWSRWRESLRPTARIAWSLIPMAVVGLLILQARTQAADYIDAEHLYRDAVNKYPQSWGAHFNLGLALQENSNFPAALEQYQQAVELNPYYAEGHNNLGFALFLCGQPKQGLAELEKAVAMKPNLAIAQDNLGNALAFFGRFFEAIPHYERALEIDPDYAEAHFNLALALANTNQFFRAIGHYRESLRVKPDDAEARFNLSIALMKSGNRTDALDEAKRAADLARSAGQSALLQQIEAWRNSQSDPLK